MMKYDSLFSVGSDTFSECFLAGKSVVEGRDAALVRDDATRHTLHPDNQGKYLASDWIKIFYPGGKLFAILVPSGILNKIICLLIFPVLEWTQRTR